MNPLAPTSNQTVPFALHEDYKNIPKEILNAAAYFFPSSQPKLEPLKKAAVYKVSDDNQHSVLRKSFPTWTEQRCQREVEIAKWIAQSNAGPKVLGVSPDSRFMLIEYFNGGCMIPGASINLKEIAVCLKNLHSIGLPPYMISETESTSFKRLHGQYKRLTEAYGTLPKFLQDMYQTALRYEKRLEQYPERVLCHLDLHCHNIMRHDGRLMLVDYGMTGPDHPYFDIANFSMYLSLSSEQEKEVLHHYHGEEPNDAVWMKYQLFRPLAFLNKVTWRLITAAKLNADTKLLEDTWKEDTVTPIQEAFQATYDQRTRNVIEEVRFARSAYELFVQKDRELVTHKILK